MLVEKMGLPRDALAGKVAVITGAGRGIGKELARALAWLGAWVVIAEIAETGAETEALIRAEGGRALFVHTDVADEESIQALAQEVLEAFGRVDILVNNAIIYRTGAILETPIEVWDQVYAVNLRGAVVAIRAFLPCMLERHEGVIVTITSQEGMPYAASYFASKAALRSLALSLAAELGEGSGVYAFAFAPGMVDTPGGEEAFRAMAPRLGMSYQAFTGMGTNPGYEGLMPAEDCAAGFAYAILHARQYHGQVADPFQPLAKAGLLPGEAAVQASSRPSATVSAHAGISPSSKLHCAVELRSVLEEVNREFDELDMFRRTYARRDFQRKSGMSIDHWLEAAGELVSELEILARAAEKRKSEPARRLRARLPWLQGNLEKLAGYFRKTKKDAEGFIREPQALSAALEALARRERAVRALMAALEEVPR